MCFFFFLLAAVGLWFLLLLSVLWWRRLKGLCKLPDGKDWQCKTWVLLWLGGPCSVKFFSDYCWWVGLWILPGRFLSSGDLALGSTGSIVGLTASSKKIYTKGDIPRMLLPVPTSFCEPPLTHSSTGGSSTLTGSFDPVFYWYWCTKILFVPSKTGVSVSPNSVEVL